MVTTVGWLSPETHDTANDVASFQPTITERTVNYVQA